MALSGSGTSHGNINSHATAFGAGVPLSATIKTTIANAVGAPSPVNGATNLTRPTYMMPSARAGEYWTPELVRIHNQLVNYDGAYRI